MDHVKAILIKFVMLAAVIGIITVGIFDYGFWDAMLMALILTFIAYLLGDLMLFRGSANPSDQKKRNMVATIADLVLAFAVLWLMGVAFGEGNPFWASLVAAVVIAGGEWFFHKYLDKNVFHYSYAEERSTT